MKRRCVEQFVCQQPRVHQTACRPSFKARTHRGRECAPRETPLCRDVSHICEERRFISNIPGPLEAHKRASRRKLTVTHRRDTGLDASLAYGVNEGIAWPLISAQDERWWNSPESTHQALQPARWTWRIWDWWRPGSRCSPLNDKFRFNELEGDAGARILTKYMEQGQIRNYAQLSAALDCVVDVEPLTASEAEEMITMALTNTWSTVSIESLLLDSRLNPRGSQNHAMVFDYAQKRPALLWDLQSRDLFVRAAKLGLLSLDCTQRIICVAVDDLDEVSAFQDRNLWIQLSAQVILALHESQTLDIQGLGRDLVAKFLATAAETEVQLTRLLPLDLLEQLHLTAFHRPVRALRTLIGRYLSEAQIFDAEALKPLVQYLGSRPRDIVHKAMLRTTLVLTMSKIAKEGPAHHEQARSLGEQPNHVDFVDAGREQPASAAEKLEGWYMVLAQLGMDNRQQFTLDLPALHQWVCDGKKRDDIVTTRPWTRSERSLGALWTIVALSHHSDKCLSNLAVMDIRKLLGRIQHNVAHPGNEDVLAIMIDTLERWRVPGSSKLLKRVSILSQGHLRVWRTYYRLRENLWRLRQHNAADFANWPFYREVEQHFPISLRRCTESVNDDLATFERNMIRAITTRGDAIAIILRVLKHNRQLRRSLSDALPASRPNVTGRGQIKLEVSLPGQAATEPVLGGYGHVEIVRMMERIMWAIATTQQLSNRNAFRKIFGLCCHYIGKDRLTISMRRAIWHATVVRAESSSHTSTRWAYELIRDAEGVEMADRLVRSTINRRSH